MSKGPASGIPASGIPAGGMEKTHPPFEPGNTMALRHGAFSKHSVDPVAEELATALFDERPDLESFPELVYLFADTAARWLLLRKYVDDRSMFDDEGHFREDGLHWLDKWSRRMTELGGRLGLDPRSFVDLRRAQAEAATTIANLDAMLQSGSETKAASRVLRAADGDESA